MKRRMREIYIKSSDPFERGRQHGAQVKGEIERVCVGYQKSFEKKGYTWEEAQTSMFLIWKRKCRN